MSGAAPAQGVPSAATERDEISPELKSACRSVGKLAGAYEALRSQHAAQTALLSRLAAEIKEIQWMNCVRIEFKEPRAPTLKDDLALLAEHALLRDGKRP